MKTRLNRDIVRLQVLFTVIGVLFAASTVLFLIANWEKLPAAYANFADNVGLCIAPFATGIVSLLFLVPMLLGYFVDKLSATMFESLVFVSRISMYFITAPFAAIMAVFAIFIIMVDRSYLLPPSFGLQDLCGYIFYMLFFVEAALLLIAYHKSHNIGTKR